MREASLEERKLKDYLAIAPPKQIEAIRERSEYLEGLKVLHINSAYRGGGVAEILKSLVPLMRDVGIEADWKVIEGYGKFFKVTKALHDALQGKPTDLTSEMIRTYLEVVRANAAQIGGTYDIAIIHDPQPMDLIKYIHRCADSWVWRCHVDVSQERPEEDIAIDFLKNRINKFDTTIFTLEKYVHGLTENYNIIHPSIDPLSDKNREIGSEEAEDIVEAFGVDTGRPVIAQVSRFDPWKDQVGVIKAYKVAKEAFPDLQLVLAGGLAEDDPEGEKYLEEVRKKAKSDEDTSVLVNLSDLEVNALQRTSDVLLQKSIKEGFGLTVSEGMWKGTPVIGGNVGGIPVQLRNKELLVDSPADCAQKIVTLLENGRYDAEAEKKYVRENFLITRHLLDYLKLFEVFSLREEEVDVLRGLRREQAKT